MLLGMTPFVSLRCHLRFLDLADFHQAHLRYFPPVAVVNCSRGGLAREKTSVESGAARFHLPGPQPGQQQAAPQYLARFLRHRLHQSMIPPGPLHGIFAGPSDTVSVMTSIGSKQTY
jgi:hypothetical protein